MNHEHLTELWKKYNNKEISQPDYELGYLSWMVMTQHDQFPETDENFIPLFEGIILKLADMYPLSESEWESIQRLYFLRGTTLMIEEIVPVFGYKFAETLE